MLGSPRFTNRSAIVVRRAVAQPLVALAAFADIGVGLPYFVAKGMGLGPGRVVAATYEYGNAFLIVAGLLNMLVVLDARADKGPTIKRWRPRAQGRAFPIHKGVTHITVTVGDREG